MSAPMTARRLTKDEQEIIGVIGYVTCDQPLKRGTGTCSQYATWLLPSGLRVCSIHKREHDQDGGGGV